MRKPDRSTATPSLLQPKSSLPRLGSCACANMRRIVLGFDYGQAAEKVFWLVRPSRNRVFHPSHKRREDTIMSPRELQGGEN